MNRRQADLVVGSLVAAILVAGGGASWQAYQQRRAMERLMGSMMGTSAGVVHGTAPIWYVLGTILVAAVVAGLYLTIRGTLPTDDANEQQRHENARSSTPDTTDVATDDPRRDDEVRARVLDLLPDDERRILDPVLTSPGITQIELRDRSDFSKSKVSQTVSDLEKRGLLYREKQGRTYRIYPSDELHQSEDSFPP